VYEKTRLQIESLRSSVKLCQEGIEQVQGVHRRQKDSVVSSRGTRITKDSESSAKRALSKCIECTGGDKTSGCSVRRYYAKWALSRCAYRHRRKELFDFCNWKKNPRRGIFTRLMNTLKDSSRGSLSEG
jgi:hypothetical protein